MIRYIRNTFLLLTIVVGLVSCKKDELPPDIVGTPVFNNEFSFDGSPYLLSAGNEGLVLETNTSIISDTVYFSSSLDVENCTECGPALYLHLTGQDLDYNWGSAEFEDKLLSWDYFFSPQTQSGSDSTLIVQTSSQELEGIWYLDNVAQNVQPLLSFQFQIENYGNHEIKFESPNSSCGSPAFQNIEYFGDLPCFVNLYKPTSDSIAFIAQPSSSYNQENLLYMWTYDTVTVYTSFPYLLQGQDQNQIDEMCVTVTEQGGCSETVCVNVNPDPGSCVTNFHIDSMLIHLLSEVTASALLQLTFIDDLGMLYKSSSNNEDQPSFTHIELLEATPYAEPSKPSRQFVKVKFDIDCMLYDELGNGKIFSGIVETAFEDPGL